MLSSLEKTLFIIVLFISISLTCYLGIRIVKIIGRGSGKPDWRVVPDRIIDVIVKFVAFPTVWKIRFWPSFFHALVAWGFTFYILLNIGDVLEAFIPGFHFGGNSGLGNIYRLLGDLLSVAVLIGMFILMIRRYIIRDSKLDIRDNVLLHPKAKSGIKRDSMIVGFFILLHVGFRFVGESFQMAANTDTWQPLASTFAGLWANWSEEAIVIGEHVSFWIALGLILAFLPYFSLSKHIHLIITPINYLLSPRRSSAGELAPLDFEDESTEQFGALRIEDLAWHQIMDAYACIMCNRCQEVCPEYNTGKVLSPAALEINKRYYINQESKKLAKGAASNQTLLQYAITEEAVFACTACGACTEICPVGNDPMRDIMDIRRALVLMENNFPEEWQTAFRGMERAENPWGVPSSERMKWAEGISVPTIIDNPTPEILWWVGCAASTDVRAQKIARALAKILNKAGINYAVLGDMEKCTGDAARRAGNEYIFYELAKENVNLLNDISPKKIVTACPHCYHVLKNEYLTFGGIYEVVHHSQIINELINSGKIKIYKKQLKAAFHDPCYLGRQNGIFDEPRAVMKSTGAEVVEIKQNKKRSFCCGAGGAQMWKEEEQGDIPVNVFRMKQAISTEAEIITTACPFCMQMFEDAGKDMMSDLQVKDIAEIVADRLEA